MTDNDIVSRLRNLSGDAGRFRIERDDTRREIVESLHPDLREGYAAARGWDYASEGGHAVTDDIVARLRAVLHNDRSVELMNREASDEIERLRNRLLAEENSYDILRIENEHIQTDRNNLALEVERLRAERDAARRMVCEKEETLGCDERGVPRNGSARAEAKRRGWDCFKENSK